MGQMTQPSVIALKNDGQSTTSRANPTRFSSLKGKEKDVSKKLLIHTYSTMKTEDTEALGRYRAKSSRTKPDRVDRPVRTPRTFVHHQNSTQYCNTETVFFRYSPSSRPTSHLRCGQVEVRGSTPLRWCSIEQLGLTCYRTSSTNY